MKATIITIGDEILIGTTVDTNSAWIAQQLNLIGIEVYEILSVSDNSDHIKDALRRSMNHAELILMTGGLGPTHDDVTKKTIAELFGRKLKSFPEITDKLRAYFEQRGLPLSYLNEQLAELPEHCTPLVNPIGTAWGIWLEQGNNIVIAMPGIPAEMKAMMQQSILPRLQQQFKLPIILHQHILTAAMPESLLAERLKEFTEQLPPQLKLAYLPSLGFVKLRLSARGDHVEELQKILNQQIEKLNSLIGKYIYGYNDDVFEEVIGRMLRKKQLTLSTAESCTGGYIAHRITSIPGSSDYFIGSVISYSNEVKKQLLHVHEETLQTHGAVSEQTVKEMLVGVIRLLGTDLGIAVSGIAGPDGGTTAKPVGTVWIAVGNDKGIKCREIRLPGNRLQVIQLTSVTALEMLRRYLMEMS